MQDFRKLKVWHKAHRLAIDLERAIASGPRWNYPGLRGQVLRAAASIGDTIAEGCGKPSPLELARYSDMAAGSANETLAQLIRARDLGCLSNRMYKHFEARIDEIRRMLWSLAAVVRRKYTKRKRTKARAQPVERANPIFEASETENGSRQWKSEGVKSG